MADENTPKNNERPLPAAWTNNPYEAPKAHVDDVRPAVDGDLREEPNSVSSGRGSGWWSDGWTLFREAMGLWIGIAVAYFLLLMVLGMVPLLGWISNYFLPPILMGGLMLGCHSLQSGNGLSFGHLFAGFQKNLVQLFLVGLFYMIGGLLIAVVVVMLVFGGSFAALMGGGQAAVPAAAFGSIALAVLLGLALLVPLLMAMWYAPALVVLNDVPAAQAMMLSFKGCLRNIVPFLVYGLVGIILVIVAMIPIGLGLLLLIPTMICSTYVSYREIFID